METTTSTREKSSRMTKIDSENPEDNPLVSARKRAFHASMTISDGLGGVKKKKPGAVRLKSAIVRSKLCALSLLRIVKAHSSSLFDAPKGDENVSFGKNENLETLLDQPPDEKPVDGVEELLPALLLLAGHGDVAAIEGLRSLVDEDDHPKKLLSRQVRRYAEADESQLCELLAGSDSKRGSPEELPSPSFSTKEESLIHPEAVLRPGRADVDRPNGTTSRTVNLLAELAQVEDSSTDVVLGLVSLLQNESDKVLEPLAIKCLAYLLLSIRRLAAEGDGGWLVSETTIWAFWGKLVDSCIAVCARAECGGSQECVEHLCAAPDKHLLMHAKLVDRT